MQVKRLIKRARDILLILAIVTLATSSGQAHGRTHYEVLGVETTASPLEIKSRYRRLRTIYHADKLNKPGFAASKEEIKRATAILAELNVAYSVLKDPNTRAAYNRELGLEGKPHSASPELDFSALLRKGNGLNTPKALLRWLELIGQERDRIHSDYWAYGQFFLTFENLTLRQKFTDPAVAAEVLSMTASWSYVAALAGASADWSWLQNQVLKQFILSGHGFVDLMRLLDSVSVVADMSATASLARAYLGAAFDRMNLPTKLVRSYRMDEFAAREIFEALSLRQAIGSLSDFRTVVDGLRKHVDSEDRALWLALDRRSVKVLFPFVHLMNVRDFEDIRDMLSGHPIESLALIEKILEAQSQHRSWSGRELAEILSLIASRALTPSLDPRTSHYLSVHEGYDLNSLNDFYRSNEERQRAKGVIAPSSWPVTRFVVLFIEGDLRQLIFSHAKVLLSSGMSQADSALLAHSLGISTPRFYTQLFAGRLLGASARSWINELEKVDYDGFLQDHIAFFRERGIELNPPQEMGLLEQERGRPGFSCEGLWK